MKEFKNKVAAITGSATGIGRAFAEEAAKRGMRLALIDINTEGLEETKAICEKAGAAKVVTSFITDAGFIGCWALWLMIGAGASSPCTTTATLAKGIFALVNSRRNSSGN